jgi:hypothetical protein
LIDLEWPEDPSAKPSVTVSLKEVSTYAPDESLAALVQRTLVPVRELEQATLYVLQQGEELSSADANTSPSSMAVRLADAVRDTLHTDAAILNSGAVRGKKVYDKSVSYGDLEKECPYPTPMVVVAMPFSVFREAVKVSREPWPAKTPSSLQVDSGVEVDAQKVPITIGGCEPKPDLLYTVGIDVRVTQRNAVFAEYCRQHPERIPPADAGRPLLPILVEFFCGLMWTDLLERATSTSLRASANKQERENAKQLRKKCIGGFVDLIDADSNGVITIEEIHLLVEKYLGQELTSRVLVQQMLSMLDENGDGVLTIEELMRGLSQVLSHH